MTTVGYVILWILGAACGAILTAMTYENRIRRRVEDELQTYQHENIILRDECGELRTQIAQTEGVKIGRQCDALQRKMIDDMTKRGGFSFRTARRPDAENTPQADLYIDGDQTPGT